MAESKKEDDNKNDFDARDYQVRLAEMAIERNKIIYLPTGSGKTYISIMIISHFLQKNECGSKKIGQGGKRAFFLVNTVALVHQQREQIRRSSSFDVKGYSGDMGVDHWSQSVWDTELDNYKILVMTAQIFLNMLLTKIITLKDVAVIVFDECHHGVENHPMRQIMKEFSCTPEKEQPRVVGLTATLLNKNLSIDKVDAEIKTLENTFLSQIATADDENMVRMYSTNPQEFKVDYHKNQTQLVGAYAVRDQLFNRWTTTIQTLKIDDTNQADKSIKPIGAIQIEDRSKKTNKVLKNVIEDIKVNMDDLGLYGGNIAVLARLIQLQKIQYNCESEVSNNVFNMFSSKLTILRKYFESKMRNLTEFEKINKHSSDKVIQLLKILKTIKEGDQVIVFVRRRYTAKVMHRLVSIAASVDPKLKHIKCDFVVGFNVSNPFKDTRENLLQRNYNTRVLDKFNSGMLNVLFGSNVVEEGMDVSKCNMVIMFDLPMDFRAYLQSKGRARHSTSRYIILNCDPKFIERHARFTMIEDRLRELLCGGQYKMRPKSTKEEVDASLFANIPGLEPYKPMGDDGPSITALSAISYINRYFANLKTDKFTRITPYWFMKTVGAKTQCFLHLPMESKVRGLVEGTLQNNKENAKRSVALEACKLLHKLGELDDTHLLPISIESQAVDSKGFMPQWDSNETFEETRDGKKKNLGTNNNKRAWIKLWPTCLTGCFPIPKTQVYLHVLELKVMKQPSQDNHRLEVFYQTLCAPVTYAIISAKPLPQLAPFPLYMSTGELEVNIRKGESCSFSKDELIKISIFHGQIFGKVLGVVKSFLIRDYSNEQNSYMIAPVVIGDNTVNIDWNMIEEINRPFPNPEVRPTDENRKSLVINDENYLGMIVTPWYRSVSAQRYIVTKVSHDMDENTPFPSDNYETYSDYFADKYGIVPLIHQPLLEVRAISSRMNNLKPISLTKALKHKNKDENEEFEVWLLPEFCYVYPVPGRYWIKAQLLPSVLHRITQLCTAEELRVRLVRDTGIGLAIFPLGQKPKKLEADASLAKHIPIETTQLLTPLPLQLETNCSLTSKTNFNIWEADEEPNDIDRDMDTLLFDIFYYKEFVNESLSSQAPKGNKFNEILRTQVPKFVNPPPLNMLKRKAEGLGPDQVQILQAITVALANDFINCERLETLGDSFLKFAISMVLYEKQNDSQEGVLTNIKGQIVGNKNLYFCGKSKNLGRILQVRDFLPREEWIPPQFCVDNSVKASLVSAEIDSSCLYNITIPEKEVFEGRISKTTHKRFEDILLHAENLKYMQTCTFTNTLALTDKNVADAVEALLGVYLENSGILGALRVMNWFQVIDPSLATEEVFTATLTSPVKGKVGTPMDHLVQPYRLEEILNYKFNDKAYMLQALSHPSYHKNNITQCYQRLEFLGDAIIDFLITVHIFERCTELHPGDLTDLRSALVNNITLACITVRHGLHRFLLHRSSSLNDVMSRFVRHQEERQHKIDNDILFLCEEFETNIAEAIEVPKVLGDVFEALIGAIYLDSGKDLTVTWRIIYNLMKGEIEKFHLDVPKNHVRMLYESKCTPNFGSAVNTDGVVMVTVEVYHEGKTISCNGFGENKRQAKRAAAKMALRKIRGSLVK